MIDFSYEGILDTKPEARSWPGGMKPREFFCALFACSEQISQSINSDRSASHCRSRHVKFGLTALVPVTQLNSDRGTGL